MGLGNIFNRRADFYDTYVKSSRRQELHVSNVIQKVVFDVNENGIGAVPPPKSKFIIFLCNIMKGIITINILFIDII